MAYDNLKNTIRQNIFDNTSKGISPATVRNTLLSMVETLGEYSQFAGIATPETEPKNIEQKVFYIAFNEDVAAQVYEHFNNVSVAPGSIVIITNDTGEWTKQTLPLKISGDPVVVPITIDSTDWIASDETKEGITTKEVEGVIADEDSQMIIVTPRLSSAEEFYKNGVICTKQGNGELSFICKTIPETDIEINVIMKKI